MTSIRLLGFTAIAAMLGACSPAPEAAAPDAAAPETAAPETAASETAGAGAVSADAPDAAALHALLVMHGDDLIPVDWNTGEPVPETSMAYWIVPALDIEESRAAECTPLAEPAGAHDCTLRFTAEPGERNRRPVIAQYRFNVRADDDGALTLVSPEVRWAVTG